MNGFLFLGGDDSNNLISQHTGRMDIKNTIPEIAYAHHSRSQYLSYFHDCQYIHIISPNKETVAAHFMPSEIKFEEFGPSPVRQYLESARGAAERTFYQPTVLSDFHRGRLYYLTDTHWTFRGAKRYLEAALAKAGLTEKSKTLRDMQLKIDDLPFVGDLAQHLGHPGEVQEHILPARPAANQAFYNGISTEGRVFHFRNSTATGRAIVLMDSTGSWMLNFLGELFNEVLAIHTPDLDLLVTAAFKPSIVLAVQCERFFPRAPRQNADWKALILDNEARKQAKSSAARYLHDLGYL
jgi:hypothetical protein